MTNTMPQEIYSYMLKITLGMNAIIMIPIFILYSIGLYTLAKKRNINNAYLAWIPGANLYILGMLTKDSPFIKDKFKNIEWFALACGVLYALCIVVPIVIQMSYADTISGQMYMQYYMIITLFVVLLSYCAKAFLVFMYYHLYKIYAPKEATLYTILSVFSFSAVLLFAIRKYENTITESNMQDELIATE